MRTLHSAQRFLLCVFAFLLALPMAALGQTHPVISQVYGGGGNGGATLRYDFIELYNPTNAAVDLSSYSIQYASTTGPAGGAAWAVAPITGTIQPRKYFLIQACIGNVGSTNGALLPTPDFTLPNTDSASCAPAIAAAAGKLALVSNITALAGPFGTAAGLAGSSCPTVNVGAIVDFVGFGAAATCSEGTGTTATPTATLSATLSAVRSASNDDTGNNSLDFSAVTPNPRNSSSGGTTPPTATLGLATATASPASVTAGVGTTLSVTVTPGSGSTGIAVSANLGSVGGSTAQAFAPGSTANVYTFQLNIGAGVAANTYALPVTVTDQQGGSAAGTITLTVVAPVTTVAIPTLQGNRNAYLNSTVTTTGVVTAVISNGFFIQTPSSTPGSTGVAEGLDVFTSTRPTVSRGDNVTVTGKLVLFPLATASHTPALEISAPAITTNSTGNPLPAPIALPANFPTPAGGIYQLTKYEGMRVTVPSLTTVSGTDGFLTESTETVTSSGEFYAVATGVARPFREPGLDFRDFPATTCPTVTNCTSTTTNAGVARPANLTLYDDNPERILVESSSAGGTALNLTAGAVLTNVTGVMDFTYSTDSPYGDPARFFLDAGTLTSTNVVASPLTVTALPLPGANQFTVAAFNIERFFNTTAADNFYYDNILKAPQKIAAANSVVVTADAYARRLKKVSLAIRTVLNNPDILSIEEVENASVLRDIAAQIDADTTTGTKPGYVAYGTDNSTTYTNDIGGISVGFLVKPSTVNVSAVEQMGAQTVFTPTGATAAQTLNDRPSDVLHATINRGAGTVPYPVTVISNHLRSLSGINTSANTRQKKELQAEMLATLIQTYQSKGEHVVAVGDLNAFQFSDGYTDTLGTITGNVGNGVAVQPGTAIVSPAAADLITKLPANQQQTYTEFGNAQVLDHVVVSADIAASSTIAVAHINADFPLTSYNDATTAARESDHDPVLTYLALPAPVLSATLTGTATFASTQVGRTSAGQVLTLMNTGQGPVPVTAVTITGDFAQSNNCPSSLPINSSCTINVVFRPTVSGARTGSAGVTSNVFCPSGVVIGTCAQFALLTGTATPAPDFTLTDSSSGAATTGVTVAAGNAASFGLTLTSINGFSGSVALSCASSAAPAGASCTVVSPITLSAAGTGVAQVTILTTARTIAAGLGAMPVAGRVSYMVLAALLCGLLLLVSRAGRHLRVTGLLVLLLALAAGISGCSSGSSTKTNPGGTPAGTYSYVVTATSGGRTHSQTINLTIQ